MQYYEDDATNNCPNIVMMGNAILKDNDLTSL